MYIIIGIVEKRIGNLTMIKIKPPSVAGKFYTADKEELIKQINHFTQNNRKDYEYATRAIIVPHAGYYYSGQIASEGFQYLDKNVETVFVIAPAHYVPVSKVALSSYDKWSTPLGEIDINQVINDELNEKFFCDFLDEAFESEHAVEVQIPFLQMSHKDIKIIPILIGGIEYQKITEIIDYYWNDPKNAFVISSDLSHFHRSDIAKKIDELTAIMIESNDVLEFTPKQGCNAHGVCSLVNFAKNKNYSLIRVDMRNSGEITSDTSSVVGYGSWILYEGEKTEFIKSFFSDFCIDVCKKTILIGLKGEPLPKPENLGDIPAVFEENGACFVTLEIDNNLRGCIGSIVAHRPLIEDLIKNAHNSAFSDPRFSPLSIRDFENLSIAISLLSTPTKLHFSDEADLLHQLTPNVDGLIIKDGCHQAVYLPSVWEQLPEKAMFLNSLKMKAGLDPEHFSKTFEAYKYKTEYITS